MKKLVVLALFTLCLSGCSQPAWETVEDQIPAVQTASWLQNTYKIHVGTPENLKILEEQKDWNVYSTNHGDFEIETRTFLSSSAEAAIKELTGIAAENLTILETRRFDLPEYRFAWVTQTEQGSRVCRADLVMDGTDCYAVICSTVEDVANQYDDEIRYVFSTFGLSADEGV